MITLEEFIDLECYMRELQQRNILSTKVEVNTIIDLIDLYHVKRTHVNKLLDILGKHGISSLEFYKKLP